MQISNELRDIIAATLDPDENECATKYDQIDENSPECHSTTKFIQLNRIEPETESSSTDCYYSNNGNSVIFRETTV